VQLHLTLLAFFAFSVPGHPNCHNATQPVNNLQQMRELVNDLRNYNKTTLSYHWYDFEHQNQIVLDMLRDAASAGLLNYTVLPAYEINLLRPDLHRTNQNDCLHNCYPGIMDVYSQMLYHFLKRERPLNVVNDYTRRYKQAYVRYRQKLMAARLKKQSINVTVVE
jgi:hypothetical protein